MGAAAALIEALATALPWWLGLHLLARGAGEPRTRRVAAGLLTYAAVLVLDAFAPFSGSVARDALALTPVLLWGAALPYLLPEQDRWRAPLLTLWRALLPLAGGVLIGALAFGAGGAGWRLALRLDAALLLALLLAQGARLVASAVHDPDGRAAGRARTVAALATLFVALAAGLLLLATALPRSAVLLAMAVDFAALGVVVAGLDGLERGERWLPELRRDALAALAAALLFGGQVALALGGAQDETGRALLLTVVLSATAVTSLARPLGALLDATALPGITARERATLRDAETAVARREPSAVASPVASPSPRGAPDPLMDRERFVRHTRRALSLLRDRGKLGSSPLTALPRLEARAPQGATTLERAHALAEELRESVARLRPAGRGEAFDPSDAARYFNVLHYPYVVGLRPYSRQGSALHDTADPEIAAALEWFQAHVPERTFYHWQREAAALVARDLLERNGLDPVLEGKD